jgi:prostamide/prostaglandin F2alpha synthase
VQPFVEGGFFKGELFVDSDKSCYKALNYDTLSMFDIAKGLLTRKWREKAALAESKGVCGNIKDGNGLQNGGALVVNKNGQTLYEYRQEDAADQISPYEILKAFNLVF